MNAYAEFREEISVAECCLGTRILFEDVQG